MDNLTSTELRVLNDVSRQRNPTVFLGTRLQEAIDELPAVIPGTPVNAVNASMDLTLTGVVTHHEVVVIDNPLVAGTDVYEFCADEAQTKSNPANIAVDITDYATKASISLTIDTQPIAGDKMTIGTKEYTFVPVGTDTADGEISIGDNLAGAQAAIVAAINGTDAFNDPHPLVSASAFAVNVCTITALVGGTAGNVIPTTETFTAGTNVFADTSLNLGTDCPAADAITALVAAITASDIQGVGATDENGDVVRLTADVAGVSGNAIVLMESLANGAFTAGATHLAGGVNGTVGVVEKPMVDASYLYLCVANNTITGKNWRRISLGAAY